MKKLLFGLIATVMLTAIVNAQGTLRADFLKGKTQDEIITSFGLLTVEQKTALWAEKIDQLLTQKFPDEHIKYLNMIKLSFSNKNLKDLSHATLLLAQITPQEDFVNMVESLKDYNFKDSFVDKNKVSENILTDINNISNYGDSNSNTDKRRKCNARYLCLMTGHGSSNCQETVDGCGPFGMSTCNCYY